MREPAGARVDVNGGDEHLRVVVEDRLSAVAVVGVDVDHGDRGAERSRSRAAATAELLR